MPVSLTAASPTPLRILFVTPEATPFAKTGGLADVAGALPRELAKLGHDVRIILPRYRVIDGPTFGFRELMRVDVPHLAKTVSCRIEQGRLPIPDRGAGGDIPVYAVRHDPYFD
ncbi:MAG: glycogen/starch synthase, partial [Nitrospirae bacterium]|nr:glycogen/starch synthase [Nitrospirota bacterium]